MLSISLFHILSQNYAVQCVTLILHTLLHTNISIGKLKKRKHSSILGHKKTSTKEMSAYLNDNKIDNNKCQAIITGIYYVHEQR